MEEYPPIKVYGKDCRQRRCIGFFSNESMGYKYSSQISLSKPFTKSLNLLLSDINNYNGILVKNTNMVKIIFQNIAMMRKIWMILGLFLFHMVQHVNLESVIKNECYS